MSPVHGCGADAVDATGGRRDAAAVSDCVVLGAGPAGLGAALALAGAGAEVTLVEAADAVGGLCRTRARAGLRYDLGGHIPFVRDATRLAWLHELLDGALGWVPRPVASVRDGRVRRGRYLDQRPAGPVRPEGPLHPLDDAASVLGRMFGTALVDAEMRPYLEKIDGVALERIPAARPLRLMRDQAAPEGFWFPHGGIGRLMDAMARAAVDAGASVRLGTRATALHVHDGAVSGVGLQGPGGAARIATPDVVVAVPAGLAASLVRPRPAAPLPTTPMRAVRIAYVRLDGAPLGDEAWVQVDDADVPFARMFEMGNWGPGMVPDGVSVVGMECYCAPGDDDPLWAATPEALTAACVAALVRLGWLDEATRARPLEVVDTPRAYPVPDLAHMEAAGAAALLLDGIAGVHRAPGSEVIAAVEAGEAAAAAVVAGAGGAAALRAAAPG